MRDSRAQPPRRGRGDIRVPTNVAGSRPKQGKIPFLSSRTLRVDILSAFIALLLVTVLTIAVFTHQRNRRAILHLSGNLIEQTADATLRQAGSYLEPAAAMAEVGARVATATFATDGDTADLQAAVIKILISYPQFAMVNVGDEHGNFLMPKKLPDGTLAIKRIRRTATPPTVTWDYMDAEGRIVRSETSAEIDYDPRERAWYTGAGQVRGRHWTDTYIFFTDRRPGITASYPTFGSDGRLLGVVGVDIELATLSEFLAGLDVGRNGVAFILNANGEVVAYPQADHMVVEGQDGPRPVHVDELSRAWIGASLLEYTHSRRTRFTFTHEKKRYIAAYRPLPASVGKDWVIGVVVPEDDFTGPLKAADRGVMLISLLILAVAVTATTFLSRSISQPIVRLTEATTRIRNLELDNETAINSPIREIQLMEDAISAMQTGLRSFRKYVPATLVRQLIQTGEDARLGGQTRELTVLFSDITDFTPTCEGMPPQELMLHLSEYLDELTRVIIEHGGTVDKYIGDGIMAFWGAPARDPAHAERACQAALASRERLAALNARWTARGSVPFPTRWGIHTGETVVGNVGSTERMNYSAIGDGVNLASRLEAVNKIYHTSIIVSQSTRDAAGDGFFCRPLGAVAVKGKQECVRIFELMCTATAPSRADAERLAMLFEAGLQRYLRREWTDAADAFERAKAAFPTDGPTAVYLQRCHEFIRTPPGPDWDCVLRLDHK